MCTLWIAFATYNTDREHIRHTHSPPTAQSTTAIAVPPAGIFHVNAWLLVHPPPFSPAASEQTPTTLSYSPATTCGATSAHHLHHERCGAFAAAIPFILAT